MSKVQWQSNDPMSVVDTSTNKIYMGTKNVKPAGDLREGPFKGDRSWVSFLRVEHSGSNIDVLSPVEALEIKYGQRIQDQLATTYRNNSGGVLWTGWRIVYERVMNSHSTIVKRYLENQEFRRKLVAKYRDFAGSKKDMLVKTSQVFTSTGLDSHNEEKVVAQIENFKNGVNTTYDYEFKFYRDLLDAAQARAEAQVRKAEDVILMGLNAVSQQWMNPETTSPAIKSRFKVNGQTLNTATASTNSNVFSLEPNKVANVPDEQMDYILTTYAKVITSPSSKNVPFSTQGSQIFHQQNLTRTYPALNMSPMHAKVSRTRNQLYMARIWASKLASINFQNQCILGSKLALSTMFQSATRQERLLIAKAAYPYVHGKNFARKSKKLSTYFTAKVNIGGVQSSVNYQTLIGDIFWLDYLGQGSSLYSQTVKYLMWVKDKVEVAKRNATSQLAATMRRMQEKKLSSKAKDAIFLIGRQKTPTKPSTPTKPTTGIQMTLPGMQKGSLSLTPGGQIMGGGGSPTPREDDTVEEIFVEQDDFEMLPSEDDFEIGLEEDFEVIPQSEPLAVDLDAAVDQAELETITEGTEAPEETEEPKLPEAGTVKTDNTMKIVGGILAVGLLGGGVYWYTQRSKR